MRRKEVRLGLIGAGPWGRNYIKTIRDLEGVSLTHLASRNPEAVDWVDADCRIVKDWKEVARAKDLDGVIVATPPALHVEMAQVAVEAGLPVLVEKPLAMHIEEAREFLCFVESRGGSVLVNHIHLFNPAWLSCKRYARDMGNIVKIESVAGNWGPFRKEVSVLWDWGPHDLALCLDILQKSPKTLDARWVEQRNVEQGRGEILQLHLGFDGGLHVDITLGNLLKEKKRSFTIFFEKGVMVFDDLASQKLKRWFVPPQSFDNAEQGESLPVCSDGQPLCCAVQALVKRIQDREYSLDDLSLAVQVTALLSEAQNILNSSKL